MFVTPTGVSFETAKVIDDYSHVGFIKVVLTWKKKRNSYLEGIGWSARLAYTSSRDREYT